MPMSSDELNNRIKNEKITLNKSFREYNEAFQTLLYYEDLLHNSSESKNSDLETVTQQVSNAKDVLYFLVSRLEAGNDNVFDAVDDLARILNEISDTLENWNKNT